jgi:hypothetical protein
MQLSTDLPCGLKPVADHLASGEAQSLQMNVSREADRAFRFELRKTDPKRWANLDTELHRNFYRRQSAEAKAA